MALGATVYKAQLSISDLDRIGMASLCSRLRDIPLRRKRD